MAAFAACAFGMTAFLNEILAYSEERKKLLFLGKRVLKKDFFEISNSEFFGD